MISLLNSESQGKTLIERLCWQIRSAILSGAMRPGAKLLSTRELQQELGISRSTVVEVFEQLISEGYIETKTGKGSFVSTEIPDSLLGVQRLNPKTTKASSPIAKWNKAPPVVAFGALAGKTIPFRPGIGALDTFPNEVWAKLTSKRLKLSSLSSLGYADPGGSSRLREQLAEHISAMRGGDVYPSQVIITSGSQQAFQLASALVLQSNQTVFIEEPGYPGASAAFQQLGVKLKPLEVDSEGASVPTNQNNSSVIFLTPSFQYPLGVEMSLARRLKMLEFANKSKSWIIEDDYDCEFRYFGRPIPSLFAMSKCENVLYCLSFSKSLAPSLRMGCLVVPKFLAEDASRHLQLLGRGVSTIQQEVFADYLESGKFKKHMRMAREKLSSRRENLVQTLSARDLPLTIISGLNGLHVTAVCKETLNDVVVAKRAFEQGMYLMPLSPLYLRQEKAKSGFLLGFGPFSESRTRDAVGKLKQIL